MSSKEYPYDTVTNKETWLLKIGGESVWLPVKQPVRILGEDNGWASARVEIHGKVHFGSVDMADYEAAVLVN